MKLTLKKSLFSFIAVSALALLLSACGTNNGTSDNESGSNEKKVLNVGTEATFAPFEFMDKGKMTGFDVDLLNALAEEAGYEVKMENTGWDAMFAGLQSKQLDIGIAGITIDKERKRPMTFQYLILNQLV